MALHELDSSTKTALRERPTAVDARQFKCLLVNICVIAPLLGGRWRTALIAALVTAAAAAAAQIAERSSRRIDQLATKPSSGSWARSWGGGRSGTRSRSSDGSAPDGHRETLLIWREGKHDSVFGSKRIACNTLRSCAFWNEDANYNSPTGTSLRMARRVSFSVCYDMCARKRKGNTMLLFRL